MCIVSPARWWKRPGASAQPLVLHVEYEGADWEVSVRVKRTEEE
jgi:hypothetical protein